MKLNFLWNVVKDFTDNIWRLLLIFISITLYASLVALVTVLFNDNKLLLFPAVIVLYLIACFAVNIFLNRESIKEQYKKAKQKDSGQIIERSYTLFIKVRGTDNYIKEEVKIDTAGKTDIEIGKELKGKVFEYLSWGYKVIEDNDE